jgi:ABC-type transport system involved in multi-copper enzyme maturation permease subunit
MQAIDMPTLVKEIRTRMRGKMAPVMIGVFVAIASLVVIAIVADTNWDFNSELGRKTFTSISVAEMILIALIGPTLSCNVISLERERQTLDFLLVTHLSPWNILMGKYLGSAGYLILLWLSIIPITAVTFILGGVSWLEFILMQIFLIVLVLLCSAIGVYASSRAPKSNVAASWAISIVIFTFFVQIGICTSMMALPGLYSDMLRVKNTNAETAMPEYLFIVLFFIASMALSYIPSSVVLAIVTFFRKKPASLFIQLSIFLAITLTVLSGILYIKHQIDIAYLGNTPSSMATFLAYSFMTGMSEEKFMKITSLGNPVLTGIMLIEPNSINPVIFSNKYYDLALSLFLMLVFTFTALSLAYGNLLRLYPQFAEKVKQPKVKPEKIKKRNKTETPEEIPEVS